MHKKVQSLVLAGVIVSSNTLGVEGMEHVIKTDLLKQNQVIEVPSDQETSEKQIYLSDIEYDRSKSNTGYGSIGIDTVHNGNTIRLIVDGETIEFKKGMGAHATSTLVYNVSQYKDTYTRLVTYLGIDARQGSSGDGARFTISTSEDGQSWTEVKDLGTLKGNNEAAYVDIPLNGANYIKLYAHQNSHNGNDHAVYGDLKLVKEDYSLAGTPIEGLQTVAQYDSILKGNTVESNIANNKETILKRTLVKRVGYESIQRISAQDQKYSDGIRYLMSNTKALEYFVMGGPVNIDGSYQKALKSFCEIYAKYKDIMNDASSDYFNLRLAISIALAYGRTETVSSWIKSDKGINPVHRYEVYQYLVSSGKMDQGGEGNDHKKWSSREFKALPIPMMRWAVDVRLSDDEILWMVDYALSEKAKGNNYFDAYNYIEYTMGHNFDNPEYYKSENYKKYNDKYNFENYFNDYGTKDVQRMWMVFEEGAVCGGLTQTYSVLSDIFGRPSSPCGQPGHAAAVTYEWNRTNNRYEWVIQNDVSGWVETGNQFDDRMLGWGNQWRNSWSKWTNASYTVLAGDASLDYKNYEKANLLVLLADSYSDDRKQECYKKALEIQNINLDAMEGLINCYKASNKTSAEFLELAKGIIKAYNYYPQTMVELLGYIETNITETNHIMELDMLKNNALIRASQATPNESTCVGMTKQMANYYLKGDTVTELATFSFDGDNANKIVINEKYSDSQIRIEYSLDGGNTWTETNQHVIELSKDELASITADNDIKLSLVGVSDVHTIDILAGNTISNSTIIANDEENLLLGNVDNLEYSTDGGNTWCSYVVTEDADNINPNKVTGIRIEGDTTVKVRYKAYGQYLQSEEVEYTFTANQDTESKTYLPLKNVKLEEYTSQQSTSRDHAATNFIDGNPNTAWHTAYRHEENKFYTVSFDKERNISALAYVPGNGANGRLRSGKILTSMDGINWTESGTFTDIGNNTQTKQLPLNAPTPCKYVKLVATETYGNSDGERNKYFSGKDIMFYEANTNNDDLATTLPDDVPVEDQVTTPDNDLDNDMMLDTDNIPSKPNYDVEDNMGVEQEGADIPVILPDDIPVEDIKPDIPVEDIKPDTEGWTNTDTLSQMHQLWNYTFNEERQTIVLDSFKGITQRDTDLKVVIPRNIGGYTVELADLKSDMFPGVTHIKVAEAKDGEGQVKVLDTDLANGFAGNDTLKYVNLEGLDVSGVDNMYGLFSFCKNLRVVEINDWVIKDTTDTTAMFYAKKDATDEEKKILVVTNNEKLDGYDFELSNRIPAIVTFNSNGGYFIGDTDILNMKVPRFVIRPETLEELDKIIESDLRFAGIPVREGYKFTGWYTEEPNPTNFYELLNMTYKARWEEVVEEETPEVNVPNLPSIEYENGTGGPNTPCTLKVNTEEGLDSIINWLNDTSVNMSYYRLKDIMNNSDGTITYQLHVFGADKLVSYINIKIDSSNAELMNKLNAINVLIGIEDINSNGQGTEEKPYEVKVNTIGGMSELLDWLIVNCDKYHKSTTVTEEDGKLIYEIYAVLAEDYSTYANNNKEIHIKVVVDKVNNEVIEYINDAILTAPDNDFDSGMNVDPDNDQVVENTPSTLPDDVPVEDQVEMPEDDNLDSDMGVMPEPSLPLVEDVVNEGGVGSANNPIVLKVNTLNGLERVLSAILNSGNNMSLSRLEEPTNIDGDTVLYRLHIVDGVYGYYVDIKVNANDTELLDILNEIPTVNNDEEIPEDIPTENEEVQDGTHMDNNTVKPEEIPEPDFDADMGVIPDNNEVQDGTHMDNNIVKPELERPDNDFDSDMGVVPELPIVGDGTHNDNNTVKPEEIPAPDLDGAMGVIPDNNEVQDGTHMDNNTVKPELENPGNDFDSEMGVEPGFPTAGDGTHNDNNTVTPEEIPSFTHDVVELVKGNGQESAQYELIVKDVEVEKFNSFLNALKTVNTVVVSISKDENYTVYKVKFNKVTRNVNEEVYAIIKVENSKTELVNTFNDFAAETNSDIVIPGQNQEVPDTGVKPDDTTHPTTPEQPEVDTPVEDKFEEVLDGTHNDEMMVTPNIEAKPEVKPDVNQPNTEEVVKPENNTTVDNSNNDNPKTGDIGIAGYAGLGLASILGIFKNRRKRK